MKRRKRARQFDEHALAPELEAVIARVVKRARLRKSEREDVRRELRSHFAGALEEGKTVEEVVEEFGDVKAAGRMIGRAKRRCRGIVWHAWVWSCRSVMGLFALVVVMYGWAAWAYYGASPTITRNYLKEINARVEAIPEKDRAWPVYREALVSIPKADVDRIDEFYFDDGTNPQGWSEARALLLTHAAALDLAVEASKKIAMACPLSIEPDPEVEAWRADTRDARHWQGDPDAPPMFAVQLEETSLTGRLALLMLMESRRALEEGEGDRWSAMMIAGLRLGRHVREGPSTLNYLSGSLMTVRFTTRIGRGVATHPDLIPDSSLVEFAHELELSEIVYATISWGAERAEAQDFLQRLYSSRTGRVTRAGFQQTEYTRFGRPPDLTGETDFIVDPPTIAGPVVSLLIGSLDEMLKKTDWIFEQLEARSEQPPWERGQSEYYKWLKESSQSAPSRMRWWPLHEAISILEPTIDTKDRVIMEIRGVQAAIAIELFRRHESRLPDSLDQLVSQYLPSVPIDTYSGKPIRYMVTDGIPIVYSIGCDLDDDGGRPPTYSLGTYAVSAAAATPPRTQRPELWDTEQEREADGDWILWPWLNPDTGEFECAPR